MAERRILVTGSSGLIGSETVRFSDKMGWAVHGVDNNMRRDFFGADGDTTWNLKHLVHDTKRFTHYDYDVRDRDFIMNLVKKIRPDLIAHCAAQPSHDLAARRPFDDFEVNALGTLNLLEATRRYCAETPFVFMSTNKVYGDAPNEKPLIELETRWDYKLPDDYNGINESCRVDACLHSLFGASKLAADILVQEYGRYFNMPTVCLRAGCLTGPGHAAAELHGFLAYVVKAVSQGRAYHVFGYKGKQVRDNLHSYDVCTLSLEFYKSPKAAAVYNLGGGRQNSISVIEAIKRAEELLGRKARIDYVDQPRRGDHICYISDLTRLHRDYPNWRITKTLDDIFDDLVSASSAWPTVDHQNSTWRVIKPKPQV